MYGFYFSLLLLTYFGYFRFLENVRLIRSNFLKRRRGGVGRFFDVRPRSHCILSEILADTIDNTNVYVAK